MKKNCKVSTRVKAVIISAAMSCGLAFSITGCGSSGETTAQEVETSSDSTTEAASSAAQDVTADGTAETSQSEITDGSYTGKITALTDTTVTVSVMGGGQGEAPDGSGAGMSAPDGKAPDGSGDGKSAPDGKAPGDAGEAPDGSGDGKSAPDMQGESEMTFDVSSDQIADFSEGDMITVVVENGAVTSISAEEAPDDSTAAGTSAEAE